MRKNKNSAKATGAALIILLLGSSWAWAGGSGRCATVQLPRPVVLPDGSLHSATTLRICHRSRLSPVAGVHEISVDGMAQGMAQSYVGRSEGPAERHPVMVFQPTTSGAYRLVGYAWPDRSNMQTYLLAGLNRSSAQLRADASSLLKQHEDRVFLAAR